MRVLVTGSAGLFGTKIADSLREKHHDVVEFDIVGATANQNILDAAGVEKAVQGCDGIIHLAAISRVAWGETHPVLCRTVNVNGTQVLLDAATASPKRPWFIFASSREVYGNPKVSRVTEAEPMAPINYYGHSKADAEALVNAASANGLKTSILRLTNVYGTQRDHPDRAIPSLLWGAIAGEDLQITGHANGFDFVHLDDCVAGFLKAVSMLANGENSLPAVNLSTGIQTSLRELADLILRISGSTSQLKVLPVRSFDVKSFCGDPAKAREVLDWVPGVELADGLKALMQVLKARGRPPDKVEVPLPAILRVAGQNLPKVGRRVPGAT